MKTKRDVKQPGVKPFDLKVILDFIFEEGLFFISVKNIGSDPVFKVSVDFDKKITGLGGSKLISSLPLFRNIEFLAPGREIKTFLDTSHSYFINKQPEQITVKISYTDKDGELKSGTINHDLSIYKDIGYVNYIHHNDIQKSKGGEQ